MLNTSHQEDSFHQGDNTLLQLMLTTIRGAASSIVRGEARALYVVVSLITWSVIG